MLLSSFQALEPLITELCRISGTPGLSLGVLHHGKVIHQASVGLRDVDAQLPPNDETVYNTASLTKAFTAAMVGVLVDDGSLNWTTQLQHVIPEFEREDAAVNVTIADLLSHRTGLPSYDSLWLLSDNNIPLSRADIISNLNYVPAAAPLRTEFIYNNLAYEALGQVVEKVSGIDYGSFLQDRILQPLNLSRTFYKSLPLDTSNVALPYVALMNSTPFQIPQPIIGKNTPLGPAGGIRSTVDDLLAFYDALIDAAYSEIGQFASTIPQNPLKQLEHLWRGMVSIPAPTLREYSYASGWMRAQLPAPLAGYGPGSDPMFGEGLPSRLALFHGGDIPGFTSFAVVLPESRSAVIVLSNSVPLADSVRLVGQLLVEQLFGNTINQTDYIEYAKSTSRQTASAVSNIKKELLRDRTVKTPAYPSNAYVGKYYNSAGNFFIDILESTPGNLKVSFMGLGPDTFDLQPYKYNSFFWCMSHDDLAQRARYPTWPKKYYIIEFGNSDDEDVNLGVVEPNINFLRWKHEFTFENDGEIFQKQDGTRMYDSYSRHEQL